MDRGAVTLTDAEHVFMYVAGLRWETHDAAGPATERWDRLASTVRSARVSSRGTGGAVRKRDRGVAAAVVAGCRMCRADAAELATVAGAQRRGTAALVAQARAPTSTRPRRRRGGRHRPDEPAERDGATVRDPLHQLERWTVARHAGAGRRQLGQARSAMELAAAQRSQDYELCQGGIANSGAVEAVALVLGSGDSSVARPRS